MCRNALQAKHTASTARALPSTQEASEDAGALVRAICGLVYVLATSAAFRLVLAEVFLIARKTAADVAVRVEQTAVVVEKVAVDVEGCVRPGDGTLADVKAEVGGLGDGLGNELSGSGLVAAGCGRSLRRCSRRALSQQRMRTFADYRRWVHHVCSYVRRHVGTNYFAGYGAAASEPVLPGRPPRRSRAVPQICNESATSQGSSRARVSQTRKATLGT